MILRSDKYILAQGRGINYETPFLIVCEGYSDARFLEMLLVENGIEEYSIGCPTKKNSSGDGKSGFPTYLNGVTTAPNFDNLIGIVIVADNDTNPKMSFRHIQKALATAGLERPSGPYESITLVRPFIGTIMIPGNLMEGTMEKILLEAALDGHQDVKKCLEDFSGCSGADTLSENKKSKMKLQSLIAAYCKQDPATSLAWIWSRDDNPIPRRNARYDFIVSFLEDFRKLKS